MAFAARFDHDCLPRHMSGMAPALWFGPPIFLLGLAVLGFFAWWPVGLALLAAFVWSRKMACGYHHGRGHHSGHFWGHHHAMMGRFCGGRRGSDTGNRAFDDYREETLRRLEQDQRDFAAFLDHLRRAKDQAEFEQFMADRERWRQKRENGNETPPAEA